MVRRTLRWSVAGLLVALAVAVVPTPSSAAPAPVSVHLQSGRTSCNATPFSPGFDAEVRRRWPGRRITAAVYDTRTGCQYRYRSDLRITTASVLKTAIMGAVLLRAQREGRSLTATERARIAPMIATSDDPAANALWSSIGGVTGMAAFDRTLGLDDTRETSPWGLTSTSAADRNELLRQLVLGQWGPFTAASRSTARSYLLSVAPSQRWGITAGVPTSWAVPLKNGFFPARCCGWRVNTSGVVERPGGGAYVATVLSDGWQTQAQGVAAVEFVSRVIASWNLRSIGPHLAAAPFARQAYRDIAGRSSTFAEEQAMAARVGADPARVGQQLAGLLRVPEVEATSGQVLRLYLGALHRLPEASTWSGRVAQVRSGERTIQEVADAVVGSAEFVGSRPLSDAEFVDRTFVAVTGVAPPAVLGSNWEMLLRAGVRRGALLVALVQDPTFRWVSSQRVRVATTYLTVLRRLPPAGALADWEERLWRGQPVSDLAGALFGSTTYADRFNR